MVLSEERALSRASWSFLTNHGAALLQIAREPRSTLREIADAIGITERAAARIVKDLRESGYVAVTREGRRNSYELTLDAALRHRIAAGYTVRDLVNALSGGDGAPKRRSEKAGAAGGDGEAPPG